MIRATISNSQLEDADKAFRIAIIGGGAGSAQLSHKAFLQEQGAGLDRPILFAPVLATSHTRS